MLNRIFNNESNQCGKLVNYVLPSVSDNGPGVGTAACNPPSGGIFPVGSTTVKSPPGTIKCTFLDKEITNNTRLCP